MSAGGLGTSWASAGPPDISLDFWTAVYQAIDG